MEEADPARAEIARADLLALVLLVLQATQLLAHPTRLSVIAAMTGAIVALVLVLLRLLVSLGFTQWRMPFVPVAALGVACVALGGGPGAAGAAAMATAVLLTCGSRTTLAVALVAIVADLTTDAWIEGARIPALLRGLSLDLVAAAMAISVRRTLPISRLANVIADEHPTDRVHGYELFERLGVGGMGEVFRARHRMLRRPAAVKLIKRERVQQSGEGEDRLTQRFRREARELANLQSPHAVQLYDFGRTLDGDLYYAMELLDGLDLYIVVQKYGRLPAGRVIHLLRQACRALGEAHARGLVHRDVKPDNLCVCRLGLELDFLKVLDFGLVKRVRGNDVRLTAQGMVTGTPGFMAPEMIRGGTVDARADIYGLGCVAYFLLTGRYVFEETGYVQLANAHHKLPVVPPSERVAGVVIPKDLEELVLACLAKEPAGRPQNCIDLERKLRNCADVRSWSEDDAATWWNTYRPRPTADVSSEAASKRAGEA